jgi:hypothetical protein
VPGALTGRNHPRIIALVFVPICAKWARRIVILSPAVVPVNLRPTHIQAFPKPFFLYHFDSMAQKPRPPPPRRGGQALSRKATIALVDQSRPRVPDVQFRVLIIGRANAGKTSILQRVCDTTESPEIFRTGPEGTRKKVRSRFQVLFQSHRLPRSIISTLQKRLGMLILVDDG